MRWQEQRAGLALPLSRVFSLAVLGRYVGLLARDLGTLFLVTTLVLDLYRLESNEASCISSLCVT